MRKLSVLLMLLALFTLTSNGQKTTTNHKSGLDIGENCPSFGPTHLSGPDHGKKTCPMCAYGQDQGVLIWLNNDDFKSLASLSESLESQSQKRGLRQFRVFVMYMNPNGLPTKEVERKLQEVADKASLKNVALTYVPSPKDPGTSAAYRINPSPDVRNTFMVYKKRMVIEKQTNVEPTADNLARLIAALDKPASPNQ